MSVSPKHHGLLLCWVVLFISPSALGQEANAPPPDTTRTSKPLRKQPLEGPVRYEARHIEHSLDAKKTVLTGKAKVAYQNMTLTAERITLDWEKRFLLAEGLPDSVWTKTESGDSIRIAGFTGLPEFTESGDVMKGEVMTYHFETRRGRVLRGRTAYEDGFYSGTTLKMMNAKTLNVADGRFTTCDLDSNPHFHFWSKRMKILVNDKVIAKPIVLFAGHIPVAALPFGMFPAKRGRHSGVLIPRYGESTVQGRYLRGIGYYWAPNDYFDVRPTLDYFERSGFLFGMDVNYQVRYRLRGSVSGSWTRKNFEALGRTERRWDLSVQHSQELSPSAQLSISGNLVSSGNFFREISSSREYRLQREIRSNATLTKRLGSSWSATVNLNQTRNLNTGDVTESIPQVSVRSGQTALFPKSKPKQGRAESHWYNQIYAAYSSQLLSRRNVRTPTSTGLPVTQRNRGWDHTLRLSSSQKLFGWLNLNPSVNYRETWFDATKVYSLNPSTNKIESATHKGFAARRTFDVSASFGTKIYGTVYPGFLKSVALRHVATPSLSLSFQPDFTDRAFGYFQSVADTTGKIASYDRFEAGAFGSTPKDGAKRLSFNLQNLFQAKIGEGENAKKIDLFNYNLSTSYDWKRPEFRLSDLSSSLRASPFQSLNFSLNARHTFYQRDAQGKRINRFLVDLGDWKSIFSSPWTRLQSLSMDMDFRVQGKSGGGAEGGGAAAGSGFAEPGVQSLRNMPGDRFDMGESMSDLDIPWNLSGTLSYSEDRSNPLKTDKRFWMRAGLDFRLTKNWKVAYQAQFDIVQRKAVSQDFSLYRDLHCWEAQVLWTPTGYKRFYLRINIKSSMLKELKFERGSGGRGLYGY